jgi:pyrrolysine biosynthesis protein PylC
VVQEFIPGPTYSVEVIRHRGVSKAIQVTDLYMDQAYDCKRVTAPSVLSPGQARCLMDLSEKIAVHLNLEGIMDVEAVYGEGGFKVLEIDARFPSQTPITVFSSCGINMVEALVGIYTGDPAERLPEMTDPIRGAVLEHLCVTPSGLMITGEHIMTGNSPLTLQPSFFGADEAITDYEPGRRRWKATLIHTGPTLEVAMQKSDGTVASIRRRFFL